MNHKFPQYLSAPFQVLWFETDDMGVALFLFLLANIFHGWFWLLFLIGPIIYSKTKSGYPKSFIKHFLYFSGLKKMKGYPTFFDSNFSE